MTNPCKTSSLKMPPLWQGACFKRPGRYIRNILRLKISFQNLVLSNNLLKCCQETSFAILIIYSLKIQKLNVDTKLHKIDFVFLYIAAKLFFSPVLSQQASFPYALHFIFIRENGNYIGHWVSQDTCSRRNSKSSVFFLKMDIFLS